MAAWMLSARAGGREAWGHGGERLRSFTKELSELCNDAADGVSQSLHQPIQSENNTTPILCYGI